MLPIFFEHPEHLGTIKKGIEDDYYLLRLFQDPHFQFAHTKKMNEFVGIDPLATGVPLQAAGICNLADWLAMEADPFFNDDKEESGGKD